MVREPEGNTLDDRTSPVMADEDRPLTAEVGEESDEVCSYAFEGIVFPRSRGLRFTVTWQGGDDDSVTGFDEGENLISPTVPNL